MVFVVPESFLAARSAELFAVFPEVPQDSALASLFRESGPVLVVVSDHLGPEWAAALTAAFVPVRRSFRRTRDMLKPPA